ncbi:MAG: HAD family phosphatase [Eubacterium sp.]|nr:HAD family phosphatase [Eubacterium sp.]
MLKHVILDMGNVLLDYNPRAALDRFFKTEEDKALIQRELFDGPEWIQGDLGYITNKQRYDGVSKRVPARLHERLRACVDGWDFCMIPLEDAIPFCHFVKEQGYGIYVLSNAGLEFYQYFTKYFDPAFFDGIVISSEVHVVKPDVRIYQTLLDKYALKADECLFIDDRKNNVEGARACGMQAHHFQNDFKTLKKMLGGTPQ